MTITLQIDGKEVKAKEAMTVLEAAKEAGVEIPTLCYLEKLKPYGACRICSVEVERKKESSNSGFLWLSRGTRISSEDTLSQDR